MIAPVSLTPAAKTIRALVVDERAMMMLVRDMINNSGMTVTEVSKRLGIQPSSLEQYYYGARTNPGVRWLVRLATICGAKLLVEMP